MRRTEPRAVPGSPGATQRGSAARARRASAGQSHHAFRVAAKISSRRARLDRGRRRVREEYRLGITTACISSTRRQPARNRKLPLSRIRPASLWRGKVADCRPTATIVHAGDRLNRLDGLSPPGLYLLLALATLLTAAPASPRSSSCASIEGDADCCDVDEPLARIRGNVSGSFQLSPGKLPGIRTIPSAPGISISS